MIRDATLNDLPALLALGALMHEESPRFRRLRFDQDRLEITLRGLIGAPHGFVMLSEIEGLGVVGGMVGAILQHWCSSDLVAYDLALYVVPENRGGFSPSRLVNAYRQWALRSGATLVQLGVTTGLCTEETANLFERLGFARCGVLLELEVRPCAAR